MPDFWKFDAMMAYKVDKNWTLQLDVYNLTNDDGSHLSILSAKGVAECRKILELSEWVDGKDTAGNMLHRNVVRCCTFKTQAA